MAGQFSLASIAIRAAGRLSRSALWRVSGSKADGGVASRRRGTTADVRGLSTTDARSGVPDAR
eukprot:13705115-Alexandrium_andersonii.AAC.1